MKSPFVKKLCLLTATGICSTAFSISAFAATCTIESKGFYSKSTVLKDIVIANNEATTLEDYTISLTFNQDIEFEKSWGDVSGFNKTSKRALTFSPKKNSLQQGEVIDFGLKVRTKGKVSDVNCDVTGTQNTPDKTPSQPVEPKPSTPAQPKPLVYAINAGGKNVKAEDGTQYIADDYVSGGRSHSKNVKISATNDDAIYSSHRWGNFTYNLPVTEGNYDVTVKFAETYFSKEGQRVFAMLVEDETVFTSLDLVAKTGANKAVDYTVENVRVTDGQLTINAEASVNNALISGVVVRSKDGKATKLDKKPAQPKPKSNPKPKDGKCTLNKVSKGLPEFSLFTVKRKNTTRKNFCDVAKWYDEADNKQVFKIFKGNDFKKFNPNGRSHARTEAQTPSFLASSKWHEVEMTMNVSAPPVNEDFTIGQIFAGCQGPVLRLEMTEKGRLKIGSVGKGNLRVGDNRNYLTKNFKVKMRSNGHRVELYIDGKKEWSDKTISGRTHCKNGSPSRFHFRWGLYTKIPIRDAVNTVTNPVRR